MDILILAIFMANAMRGINERGGKLWSIERRKVATHGTGVKTVQIGQLPTMM